MRLYWGLLQFPAGRRSLGIDCAVDSLVSCHVAVIRHEAIMEVVVGFL